MTAETGASAAPQCPRCHDAEGTCARGLCGACWRLLRREGRLSEYPVTAPRCSVPDLAALGLTYRRLDYWARTGILSPAGNLAGSGHQREWPAAELEVAARIARLADAGLPLAVAARFARDSWPCGEIAPGIELRITSEADS